MKTKDFFIALFEMLIFKSVTNYPRWFEIFLGVAGWFSVAEIAYGVLKIYDYL